MPELPEVQTTVNGINKTAKGQRIIGVWSDYHLKTAHGHRQNLKNKNYFENFKKKVEGSKILWAERMGKNIIIHLSNGAAILTHMKMTGHYLYGDYAYDKKSTTWTAENNAALKDPYNRFIHLVFSLGNGKSLVLSDVRRFAKVILIDQKTLAEHPDLKILGPNPLEKGFTFKKFKERILKKPGPIKSVLMNQENISGIGNIYSDEMLWAAGVHPEERVENITEVKLKKMYAEMKKILKKSIRLGGDSTSDYRNLEGERGGFQNSHMVYRRKGEPCLKKDCKGVVERIVVRGRSSHFCPKHQQKC